jgi:hypothetical protein
MVCGEGGSKKKYEKKNKKKSNEDKLLLLKLPHQLLAVRVLDVFTL